MNKSDFSRPFEMLCHRFNKPLKHEFADLYFERIKNIPGMLFEQIIESILDNYRNFPTPQEIKNEFHLYLTNHPEKKVKKQITPCPYCDGLGWLEYLATEEGHNMRDRKTNELKQVKYRRVCRCGYCDNWRANCIPSSFPVMTVRQIKEKGYELTGATEYNLECLESKKKLTFLKLNECVKIVSKEIPCPF